MSKLMKSKIFTFLVLAIFFTGCAVSDVEPFADATVELRRAVIESGAVTAETMAAAEKTKPSGNEESDAEKFVDIWQDRVKLVDVLLGYSDALAGVAAAGVEAGQTTEALGNSVMKLAGIVPGTGSAVEAGVQLGQILIRAGIQIKTHRDLGEAVGDAHPALTEVAKYLEADLNDLRILYVKASQDIEDTLDKTYGKRESDRKKLLAKRDKLRDEMLNTLNDTNIEQVKKIEELIAYMEAEHQEYVKLYVELFQKRTATTYMFNKAKVGVRAWVQAHEELKLAIEQNRRPNVRLILSTAQEIKDAVDRIRNQ
jgi:hypothetical protein